MAAYYNENEPFCVQWLRNLVAAGHIAPGDVDDRSIVDVQADNLRGYEQCHFFAGIGGWSYALRLAGWPDDRPVWTGSCPCQPFSSAAGGLTEGFASPKHLWPYWLGLIAERHPPTIFGEQVASASRWLALVRGDLEGLGYAVGAMPIEAASVGARHARDRFWFVAHADQQGEHARPIHAEMAQASQLIPDSKRLGRGQVVAANGSRAESERPASKAEPSTWRWWDVEPAVGRLAHGIPNRVGRLHAYGNAIVPQVAAQFIAAVMECVP